MTSAVLWFIFIKGAKVLGLDEVASPPCPSKDHRFLRFEIHHLQTQCVVLFMTMAASLPGLGFINPTYTPYNEIP